MKPLPHDFEAKIVDHIRAGKKAWRVGAITLLIIGAITYALGSFLGARDAAKVQRLSLLVVPVALPFLLVSLGDPRRAGVLRLLRERAESVVWLYVYTQQGSAPMSWIRLGLDDGRFERISAKLGEEDGLLAQLSDYLPRATCGFSPELQERFRSNPASLRRN